MFINKLLLLAKKRIKSDLEKVFESDDYSSYIQQVLEFDDQLRLYTEKGEECQRLILTNERMYEKWISNEVSGINSHDEFKLIIIYESCN